jgi:hypothetical protein
MTDDRLHMTNCNWAGGMSPDRSAIFYLSFVICEAANAVTVALSRGQLRGWLANVQANQAESTIESR